MKLSNDKALGAIKDRLSSGDVFSLSESSLEDGDIKFLSKFIPVDRDLYVKILLGVVIFPKHPYDWNVGFLVPYLDSELLFEIVEENRSLLCQSEGIGWGLGEIGTDDPRVVDFLYYVCEQCLDVDAWWCAAEALEKLGEGDAVDIKKKTLKDERWNDLTECLNNLDQRPAVIGVLRNARYDNTRDVIIPRCLSALSSGNKKAVQNAVWLIERLRIADSETLSALNSLYEVADDSSKTLRPRIIEAYGQLAAPETRELLEEALQTASYFRTRSYAAIGLGRIGDQRSLSVLAKALVNESDHRVIGYISEAIYAIRTPSLVEYNNMIRNANWPETGMVNDSSNDWYTHANIYDEFSQSEDPLGVALDLANSRIPDDAKTFLDLATGTGRFAIHLAHKFPEAEKIAALDFNGEMHKFLKSKLSLMPMSVRRGLEAVHGDASALPFSNESFDCVVSSWGFPSKMWDPGVCYKQTCEVERVLRPGGVFLTIGWDETFEDEMSELWYRFVPEPDFRRETFAEWRKRRRQRITSPRNCHLTFEVKKLEVPLLFKNWQKAAEVVGHLFGQSAGYWMGQQQRSELLISVGITLDTKDSLKKSIEKMKATGVSRRKE